MHKARDYRSEERFHLRVFLRTTSALHPSQWYYSDKPDLVVRVGARRIGVEHTQVFREPGHGLPMQAREALEDRLVSEAWCHYSTHLAPRTLHVSIAFDPQCKLRVTDVGTVAIKLALAIQRLDDLLDKAGTADEQHSFECWQINRTVPELFPPLFQHIFYSRVSSPGHELWSPIRSCMVPDLCSLQIQSALDRKEPKLSTYRGRCDAIWLLLVADGGAPSTYQTVVQAVLDHPYRSSFDRVFLLERFMGRAHELLLRRFDLPDAPPN